MTPEVVVEAVEEKVTLDHVVVPDLVNVLEAVPKTDVLEAGLKASPMTTPEVIPNHLPRAGQGHNHQEIKHGIAYIAIQSNL